MCQFISFHHNPLNGDIAVSDLNSHSNTEEKLKLNLNVWREGHYLPDGTIDLRFDNDRVDKVEYELAFRNRFPRFVDFFTWALRETNQLDKFDGELHLDGLTTAKGLVLPKTVGELYLNRLTTAEKDKLRKKYPKITID